MTNFELLDRVIKDSGMPITTICKRVGMSRQTFYNRCNGKGEFTGREIQEFTDVLGLSRKQRDDIFLV